MISYQEFLQLRHAATDCETEMAFIRDCGDRLTEPDAEETLRRIWAIRDLRSKSFRELTGLNRVNFCKKYGIPTRTCQNWDLEHNNGPEYTMSLLAYVLVTERK